MEIIRYIPGRGVVIRSHADPARPYLARRADKLGAAFATITAAVLYITS